MSDKVKRPSRDDMYIAAEWLSANEGDNGESEACVRVAEWLEATARADAIRQAARRVGCTVKVMRSRMDAAPKEGL